MNTIEKKLKTDGKQFNHIPNNAVHDKILQNLNNPKVDFKESKPFPLTWLLPIAMVFVLVTVTNISLNTATNPTINTIENKNLESEKEKLDQLVKNIENNITSEIENEQIAILNDIKQFNSLLML